MNRTSNWSDAELNSLLAEYRRRQRAAEDARLLAIAERQAALESALAGESAALEEKALMAEKVRDLSPSDVWIWLGDGSDDLPSMGEGMAVVIRAGDLRAMLSRAQAVGWQRAMEATKVSDNLYALDKAIAILEGKKP